MGSSPKIGCLLGVLSARVPYYFGGGPEINPDFFQQYAFRGLRFGCISFRVLWLMAEFSWVFRV